MVAKILTVTVPSDPVQVIEVQVPGLRGPAGPVGPPGPPDIISIGTIATSAAGTQASATISGASPNRFLNLTIPRGDQGNPGPPNTLTIGTINTLAEGQAATGTITGTSPNQILNLSIPRGYGVRSGGATGDVLQKLTGTDYDTGWVATNTQSVGNTIAKRDSAGDIAFNKVVVGQAPTLPEHATRKDYVDTKLNLSGGTMTGTLTIADMAGIKLASQNNRYYGPDTLNPMQDPFPSLWHDVLAFNRHFPTPLYETSADGATGWTVGTRNDALFAQKESQNFSILTPTVKGARWTWTGGNIPFSNVAWLVIGFAYDASSATRRVLLETSADGVTWTARHDSTHALTGTPAWHYVQSWGGDTQIRLSLIATTAGNVRLSTLRMLSFRWGDQGGGSEFETPFDWDKDRGVTLVRGYSNNAPVAVNELTRKDYVDGKTWPVATISDSTAVGRSLVTATDAAAARAAIGAGTSSLAIGTTSTTAKAGDYTPPDSTTGAKGLIQLTNHLGGTATAPTVRSASETQTGIVGLATAAETTTGTDNTRAVHPQGLKVELDKKATVAGGILKIEQITQAAYDALGTKIATTLYVVVG